MQHLRMPSCINQHKRRRKWSKAACMRFILLWKRSSFANNRNCITCWWSNEQWKHLQESCKQGTDSNTSSAEYCDWLLASHESFPCLSLYCIFFNLQKKPDQHLPELLLNTEVWNWQCEHDPCPNETWLHAGNVPERFKDRLHVWKMLLKKIFLVQFWPLFSICQNSPTLKQYYIAEVSLYL